MGTRLRGELLRVLAGRRRKAQLACLFVVEHDGGRFGVGQLGGRLDDLLEQRLEVKRRGQLLVDIQDARQLLRLALESVTLAPVRRFR